jgi:hypothetical protein
MQNPPACIDYIIILTNKPLLLAVQVSLMPKPSFMSA